MKIVGIVPTNKPPSVTVNGILAGSRALDVKLKHVVHIPEARAVVIRLEPVSGPMDDFAAQPAGRARRFSRVVTLPGLNGKKLAGYRVIVRDQEDHDLAELVWP